MLVCACASSRLSIYSPPRTRGVLISPLRSCWRSNTKGVLGVLLRGVCRRYVTVDIYTHTPSPPLPLLDTLSIRPTFSSYFKPTGEGRGLVVCLSAVYRGATFSFPPYHVCASLLMTRERQLLLPSFKRVSSVSPRERQPQ